MDAHTPFPIHGIDPAIGIRRTRLNLIVLSVALCGAAFAVFMQWYTNAADESPIFPGYAFLISGKPEWSLPANIPVVFELIVLSSAFTTFFGMWALNQLPKFYNPLFKNERFKRATVDRYFLFIPSNDPKYNEARVQEQMNSWGASHVDKIEEDAREYEMPKWVKPTVFCLLCAALLPPAAVYRARGMTNELPRLHVVPDMDWQEKFKAQQLAPIANPETGERLFADGRVMRPDVEGSVARGGIRDNAPYYRGFEKGTDGQTGADGKPVEPTWLTKFPTDFQIDGKPALVVDEKMMALGKTKFEVYCAVCHGQAGEGDGLVNQRALALNVEGKAAWTAAKSLHDPAVAPQPVGRIFDTISNGRASMGPYGDQIPVADRWAIVLYVKALQATYPEGKKSLATPAAAPATDGGATATPATPAPAADGGAATPAAEADKGATPSEEKTPATTEPGEAK